MNNYNNKPYSNYFSSFSLETLQKNKFFKLFDNINSFLFEIKDSINDSFLVLETPGNVSITLYVPINSSTTEEIKFEIKIIEKTNEETIKDLNKYIEILEKERMENINIIKQLYERLNKNK